ncbi:MAG: hypothetical protein WDO73_07265 [Ignavibacteriota bacterium]
MDRGTRRAPPAIQPEKHPDPVIYSLIGPRPGRLSLRGIYAHRHSSRNPSVDGGSLPFAAASLRDSGNPVYQKYLSPASPQEVVAARKVDRIAWVDYAEGKRNAYTAVAPLFVPLRLTNFLKDDGIMMSAVKISDDGSMVIFLRGEQPNRDGWAPNPSADPNGPEHAIWAARTAGGPAWRVVDATNPELAPDGSSILFVKSGQIYRAKLTPEKPATEVDRGEKAFITEWGVQSDPKFSPMAARSHSSARGPITVSSWSMTSRRAP